MKSTQRVHLVISGDVQGVGYRMWVRGAARKLGLIGWVKNREDGTVEVVAEGAKKGLEEFADRCKRGPDVAWVEKMEAVWEKTTGEFVGFEVVY